MYRTALILVLFGPTSVGVTDEKNIAAKLDGTYSIISGEEDGAMVPTSRFEGTVVVFKGNTIVLTDKSGEKTFSATFVIDATARPFKITMTNTTPKAQIKKAMGVIDVNGDTVSLCYNLPGGAVPTQFRTTDNQHCFVMKRIAK
jgi:uncharacterized protein (TIGR03067 family)